MSDSTVLSTTGLISDGPTSHTVNDDQTTPVRKILRFIPVRQDITGFNLTSLLLASMFAICFAVFLNAAQAFVLSDVLGIGEGKGDISGSLSLYDEIMSIPAAALWGAFSDRTGRRPVWVICYLIISAGLFLYTIPNSVYPGLLLVRLLFSVGVAGATAMLTATLADYSGGQRRGVIASLCGISSGIGALIAVFVFLPLPTRFSAGDDTRLATGIRATYFLCGGLAIVLAILLFFGLKRDPTRSICRRFNTTEDQIPLPTSQTTKDPFYLLLWRGILAARDPRIALAYITGFVARGDSIVISTFITLWVNEYYIRHGLCERASSTEREDIKSSCAEAYRIASMLSGVAEVFALLGAPLFGWLADRFTRGISVMVAGISGLLGCFCFGLANTPTQGINYLWVALIGCGQIGAIVTSLGLAGGHYVPEEIRGSVAGVYSLIGGFGIMLASKLGGMLFDSWWMGGPFVVMGSLHTMVTLSAFCVFIYERRKIQLSTSHHT
jgi:MFS family permease